jgi:hypothetical protein
LAAARLAADDAERAAHEVEQAIARWSHRSFHVQHYNALWARASLALYGGRPAAAWHMLSAGWGGLRRSLLLRVQAARIEALHLRARSALATAAAEPADAEVLGQAVRDLARIRRERTLWGDALALLLEAGLTATRGDRAGSLALLEHAEKACQSTDLGLYAAAARWRRGKQLGGPDGTALAGEAEAWMRGQTIVNPERMCLLLAPGCWT